ncbi:hypothetical protein T05_11208, partial [Trichinella murrelli]
LPGCTNDVFGLNVFASATLVSFLSAESERLTMRLEDAHGRMDAVMELMTAVFNSPDAIPLNR